MPRPERFSRLVLLPTGEHPVQLNRQKPQFFASIQNAFGFCQPVIQTQQAQPPNWAQALRLLFGRFGGRNLLGLQTVAFSAPVCSIIAISIVWVTECNSLKLINHAMRPTFCTYIWCLSPSIESDIGELQITLPGQCAAEVP